MKDIRFARLVVLVNCAVPGALLAWDATRQQLGANPVKFAILTTGMLTLIFLSLSLLVTPLRRITGWNWLIFFRRTLGLYAFFYACTHFLIFFLLDRSMSLASTGAEMIKRPYLVIGTLGLTCLAPLAATSTDAMLKRLGAKRWHLLHRLAYVAAIAGVTHFYMQAKADKRKPIAFAVALGILLGYRLAAFLLDRQRKKSEIAAAPASTPPLKPKIWSGQLRVLRIIQETSNVRTFRIQAVDGGDLPFGYLAGQYLNLSLFIAGKRVNRSYTIASSPTRPTNCELTIKREERGLASGYLHDTVREGDLLNVSAPAGKFTFQETESDSIVLVGGGVGITPLMSILRSLTDRNWAGEIYLVYSVRQEGEFIFAQELELLRQRHKNLHICLTVSRPDDPKWAGHRGRITQELLERTIPDLAHQLYYVCGPAAMMESVMEMLRGLGVPANRIRSEAFVYATCQTTVPVPDQTTIESLDHRAFSQPDAPGAFANGTASNVTFSISGKTVQLLPNQTVLETAEAAGLMLEFECRSGICGKCKKRLLSGSVVMEVEDALSPTDKASRMILLCQARATQSVVVEA